MIMNRRVTDEAMDEFMRSAEMETQAAEIDDVREQLESIQEDLRAESTEIVVAITEMEAMSERLWSRAAAIRMLANQR